MLLLTRQSMLRALQRHTGNPVHIILRSPSLCGTKPRKILRRAIYLSSKGSSLSFWNQPKSWLCFFRSSSSCLCGRRYYSDMKDDEQVKSWLSEIQRDFDKDKNRKQNHAAQKVSDRDEHILTTAAENDDENLEIRKKSEADNGSEEVDVHGFTVDEIIDIIKQSQNNENIEAGNEKSGGSDLENVSGCGTSSDSDSSTSSDNDSSTSSDSESSSESEEETVDNTNISGGKININTDKKASKNNASLSDLGTGLKQTDIHKASSRMTVELSKLIKRKPVILIDEDESENALDERTPDTTSDKDDGANAVKVKKRKLILISDDDELLDLSERGRPVVKVDKDKFETELKRKRVFFIDEDELINVSNERTPEDKLDKFDSLSDSSADDAKDSKPASGRSSDEEADIMGSKGTDKDEIEDFSNIDFQVSEEAVREWEPPVALTRGLTGVYDIEDLVKVLESCRARDIAVIKIPDELDYAHYMVIVTCLSLRHIKAVAHDVRWIAHNALMVDEVNDIRIIGVITITLLLAIAIIGMEWEARAQLILLAVLLIAMANFFIGTFIPPTKQKLSQGFVGYRGDVFLENFGPSFRDGEGFFSVFSIFFPAATGILAGANISGDLKSPGKDIPQGTMLAILISTISYIVVIWVLGTVLVKDATGSFAVIATQMSVGNLTSVATAAVQNSTSAPPIQYTFTNIQNCSLAPEGECRYGLMNDYQAMDMVSGFGPLITAGIFSATLSSALASLVGAPKVFQALCKDKIFPKIYFFAKGYGTGENPRRAYVLAYVIGLGFILIGDLNAIAPIISNFFLMAYTLINYSCFDNSLAKSPGWRPSFKYYSMWLSLLGALLCITVMFVINWWTALVTFAVIAALFVYVHYSKPDVNWGSSSQAHVYKGALQTALKLVSVEDHIKNFRPQVLVLTGFPCVRPELLYFVNALTKKISLMVCGHIIVGNDHAEMLKEYRRYNRRSYVYKWLQKRKMKAFYSVTTAPDFRLGAQSLMQNVGIGKLRPNILLMGFKSTWMTDDPIQIDRYFNVIHDAFDFEYGVGILRMPERMYQESEDIAIDETLNPNDEENNYDEHSKMLKHKTNKHTDFFLRTPSRERADEDDTESLPGDQSRRTSSPEIDTPPKDFEMSQQTTPDDHAGKTLERSLSQIDSNVLFSKKQKGTIDVWWLFDDGGLTLLVPYILSTKSKWKKCGLRVFTAGTKRGELVREQKQMAQLLSKFRIECQDMKIITDIGKLPSEKSQEEFEERLKGRVLDEDKGETLEQFPWKTTEDEMLLLKEKTNRQMRLRELLLQHSQDASLIVMTLPVPRKGTCSSSLYMAWLETLTKGMPPILLLRGNQSSVLTFYS